MMARRAATGMMRASQQEVQDILDAGQANKEEEEAPQELVRGDPSVSRAATIPQMDGAGNEPDAEPAGRGKKKQKWRNLLVAGMTAARLQTSLPVWC